MFLNIAQKLKNTQYIPSYSPHQWLYKSFFWLSENNVNKICLVPQHKFKTIFSVLMFPSYFVYLFFLRISNYRSSINAFFKRQNLNFEFKAFPALPGFFYHLHHFIMCQMKFDEIDKKKHLWDQMKQNKQRIGALNS